MSAKKSMQLPHDGEWEDATDFFEHVCSQDLQLGEMIHSPAFNLFDIMSAVEMMDPKMDPMFNFKQRVASVSERLENGTLPAVLPLAHVLEIMDGLLVAEVRFKNYYLCVNTQFQTRPLGTKAKPFLNPSSHACTRIM